MKNVTAGQSTKYAIAARDLANAPSDPEKRYIWATNECIKKLTDCTQDDVAVAYDTLIEQSCRAAGVTIQVAKTSASMGEKPTQKKCETNIKTCITKKCGASYESCGTDADIDRSVSECAIDAKGCEEYISGIRDTAKSELNSLIEHNEAVLRAIAQKKQQERDTNVNTAFINCENNIGITSCETKICNKLEGKCTDEYAETEKAMAKELCKYHKTACTMLK